MSLERADIDAQIAMAEDVHAEHAAGSVEHRAASARLAAALATRYVQHGGADDDRARAARLAQDLLADKAATPEQRQAVSLLLLTLTAIQVTPAAALRDVGPGLDADVLRRTERWRADTDPAAMLAGFQQHIVKPAEPAELITLIAILARPSRT